MRTPCAPPGMIEGVPDRPDANRRADLAQRLTAVRARIDAACEGAGRPAGSVALVAVTKTVPRARTGAGSPCCNPGALRTRRAR